MSLNDADFWRQKRRIEIVSGLAEKDVEIFYENPCAPQEPSFIVLLAHPHPLYGGNWNNKLISTMARRAHAHGMGTVRVHFSSVEGTAGPYVSQEAELNLLTQVLSSLQKSLSCQWLAAGFSFGGGVVAALPLENLPRFVIAPSWQEIAQPLKDNLASLERLTIVHAQDDLVVPVSGSDRLFELLGESAPHRYEKLSSGGHFFQGHEELISQLFDAFLQEQP